MVTRVWCPTYKTFGTKLAYRGNYSSYPALSFKQRRYFYEEQAARFAAC